MQLILSNDISAYSYFLALNCNGQMQFIIGTMQITAFNSLQIHDYVEIFSYISIILSVLN